MHLWPSLRIRDSFKSNYLKKLDWNLQRMKSEKEGQTNQKLLEKEREVAGKTGSSVVVFCREFLMILSCCYCCFCCGACLSDDEDEN